MTDPPGSQVTSLLGVSCGSDTVCAAIGDWSTNANGFPSVTLAEQWNGTGWVVQPTPNKADEPLAGYVLGGSNGITRALAIQPLAFQLEAADRAQASAVKLGPSGAVAVIAFPLVPASTIAPSLSLSIAPAALSPTAAYWPAWP